MRSCSAIATASTSAPSSTSARVPGSSPAASLRSARTSSRSSPVTRCGPCSNGVPEAGLSPGARSRSRCPTRVDARAAAQSFHWFDRRGARRDASRARPGGGSRCSGTTGTTRPAAAGARRADRLRRPRAVSGRGAARRALLSRGGAHRGRNRLGVEPDALVGYLSTTSMFVTMEAGARDRRLAVVQAIAGRHGDRFPLPRLTYVFAFERLS